MSIHCFCAYTYVWYDVMHAVRVRWSCVMLRCGTKDWVVTDGYEFSEGHTAQSRSSTYLSVHIRMYAYLRKNPPEEGHQNSDVVWRRVVCMRWRSSGKFREVGKIRAGMFTVNFHSELNALQLHMDIWGRFTFTFVRGLYAVVVDGCWNYPVVIIFL